MRRETAVETVSIYGKDGTGDASEKNMIREEFPGKSKRNTMSVGFSCNEGIKVERTKSDTVYVIINDTLVTSLKRSICFASFLSLIRNEE